MYVGDTPQAAENVPEEIHCNVPSCKLIDGYGLGDIHTEDERHPFVMEGGRPTRILVPNNSVIPKILEQAGILFGALPQTLPGEMISPGPPAI
jgi:hypothetical protein